MNKHMIKTTRHAAEYGVNLAQRRTWYAAEPTNQEDIAARMVEIKAANEERAAAQRRRNDFEKPRAGTFATLGEAREHPAEAAHISWVTSPVDNALEQLRVIAANDRLTPQARGEDFTTIKRDTLAELEERYDNELAEIEDTLVKLEGKARRPFSSALDAGKLNYLRETLNAQVSAGRLPEYPLYQRWEQALAENDVYTVQVLYDNGEALARAGRDSKYRAMPMPAQFDTLMQRSDDALRTPEQRKARADVLKWEATRWQVRRAYIHAEGRIKNATMQVANGKLTLVDGHEQQVRNMIRGQL